MAGGQGLGGCCLYREEEGSTHVPLGPIPIPSSSFGGSLGMTPCLPPDSLLIPGSWLMRSDQASATP